MTGMLVLGASGAMAQTAAAPAAVNATIDALAEPYVAVKPVAADLARLIFFRPLNDKSFRPDGRTVATIYLEGDYHASLVPGGYAEACVKPGSVDVGLRMVEAKNSLSVNAIDGVGLRLKGGQNQFIRITEQNTRQMRAQIVSADQAAADLSRSRLQVHTISRAGAALPCRDGDAVAERALVGVPESAANSLQAISLASDALFAFGKSDRNGMSLAGRQAIDKLMARVKSQYVRVDRLHVVGYADAIGGAALNARLSAERALTVRDYMMQAAGSSRIPITSEGRGSRELVLKACGNAPTPENKRCHQPNRRVVVEVNGVRR